MPTSAASASEGMVKDFMASDVPSPDLSLAGYSSVHGSYYESISSASETASPDTFFRPLQKIRLHKAKVNIKPLLKGRSRDDPSSTSIDLSRSSMEHEGLGIYTNLERDTRYIGNRANVSGHYRSISESSSYSATVHSSTNRPGSQYVHPRRQTPRPPTLRLSQSDDSSAEVGSFSNKNRQLSDMESPARPSLDMEFQFSTDNSATASRYPEQKLRKRTNCSPSHAKPRLKTQATLLLPSRTLDRSKTCTSVDPLSHAATVQAARQAFEEKEAAKALKFEMQRMKAQNRELRRSKKGKGQENGLAGDNYLIQPVLERGNSCGIVDSSDAFGAGSSPGDCSARNRQISKERPQPNRPSTAQSHRPNLSSSKRNWMLFLTWLRTRVFKLRRRLCGP
ncbi:hypothetical protein VTN96DRAFT_4620 [Rasamsonia emersonii]|uniref:Uncharacterized protein n=1 Tax=Rasamsonia emersonii (strain ATCC 16479 / CBS 393.64 / IMI 116815) TaxID=1408163 RepID=A0A0F4YVH4_RASE3|nr:hypothetical protein T310_3679 [Rasamsonia emersonii CBS 393.64]KKA22287.1 hypothetical protein T310_3679 [Rasamsonia emersonii CBS 393.64]